MIRLFPLLLTAFCIAGICGLNAAPVKLEPVESTAGPGSHLEEAADGINTPENGWVVPQTSPQAAVFRCASPLEAGRFRLWMAFSGAQKRSFFEEFSISTTTDPTPSLRSHWDPFFPITFTSDQGRIERTHPHLFILGNPANPNIRVDGALAEDHVTGIRIEVWPSSSAEAPAAVLTELRAERTPSGTTNIALGCPATASRALPEKQCAEFLTDGLAGSYAHPADPNPGQDFYFEIDLLCVRDLDHITLRSRPQAGTMARFTHLHVQLFDEKPGFETPPVWSGQSPSAGIVRNPGAADVLRASDGQGIFQGRYLRVFSTSGFVYAPELAEVEVYESLVPPRVQVQADDSPLPARKPMRIPATTNWLTFKLGLPSLRDGMAVGRRWRIIGVGDAWLPANSTGLIETRGLAPGQYLFEAQLRHSDLEWNSASVRLPFIVVAPWWKSPAAQWVAALALAAIAALLAWWIARRRLALQLRELERRQALSRERARIARNMHDVVGARLTQLALLHELFSTQHDLPEAARGKLNELSATAREAVSAMDEAVWAVNPRNDSLQNVADYLCHSAGDYLRPLEIACRLHLPEAWPEMQVGAQKRHELLLAFKEALHNVLKHAGASMVTLTLRYSAPNLIVVVDDNGRGLPKETAGAEKDGLENMRSRLVAVGGSCEITARPEGGTRVEMILPI